MRKLVFAINVTMDGCCDHTRFNPDDEVLDYFTQLTGDADTFVYGRKTYELMVPYWPDLAKAPAGTSSNADLAFARAFDAISNIVVFSASMTNPEDGKTRIVRTDLHDEILRMKQQPGKNILTGGVSIPSQLMELGLIDEYHIIVHPIIAGAGRRLFDTIRLPEQLLLKPAEPKVFRSGVVALQYER